MKRITSIVLAALMLMTLIPTGIASATTTPEPYFELGFSETEGVVNVWDVQENATVVTESTSTKTNQDSSGAQYMDHRPIYRSGPADSFNYLQFGYLKDGETGVDADKINAHSRVLATFDDSYLLSGTTGTPNAADIAPALTVEMWAKLDKVSAGDKQWGGLFAFGTSFAASANSGQNKYMDVTLRHQLPELKALTANQITNANPGTIPSSNFKSYANTTNLMDKWVHLVYIREYDATTKMFTTTLYVDGQKGESYNDEVALGTSTYDKDWNLLSIGGAGVDKSGYGRSLIGGIATFKVYDMALSAEQIATAFDNSYETYKIFKPVCDGTFGEAEDGNPTIDVEIVGSVDHATVAELDTDGIFKADIGSMVVTSNGKEIRTEMINYDKATQTATIKFIDNIGYSEALEISMPTVAATDVAGRTLEGATLTVTSPAAPADAIFASGEAVVETSGGAVTLTLEINNAGEKELYFDLVVRDSDGTFKKMVKGTQDGANLTVTTSGIVESDKVTAIAWYLDEVKGATAVSAPISLIWE